MNVQTIQMDPRIAAIYYKDYRKKVREHQRIRMEKARALVLAAGRDLRSARSVKDQLEREDEVTMASYREMAKGMRIINVCVAIRDAGLDAKMLPKLAIGRANWGKCFLNVRGSDIFFNKDAYAPWHVGSNQKWDRDVVHFTGGQVNPGGQLTNIQWRKDNNYPSVESSSRVSAVVPSIPAHLRPEGDLSTFHILWEAVWDVTAPVDPLLLRHIMGNMYTVLAQWDLSNLERSVLEGGIG